MCWLALSIFAVIVCLRNLECSQARDENVTLLASKICHARFISYSEIVLFIYFHIPSTLPMSFSLCLDINCSCLCESTLQHASCSFIFTVLLNHIWQKTIIHLQNKVVVQVKTQYRKLWIIYDHSETDNSHFSWVEVFYVLQFLWFQHFWFQLYQTTRALHVHHY